MAVHDATPDRDRRQIVRAVRAEYIRGRASSLRKSYSCATGARNTMPGLTLLLSTAPNFLTERSSWGLSFHGPSSSSFSSSITAAGRNGRGHCGRRRGGQRQRQPNRDDQRRVSGNSDYRELRTVKPLAVNRWHRAARARPKESGCQMSSVECRAPCKPSQRPSAPPR